MRNTLAIGLALILSILDAATVQAAEPKPVRFILVGDSTMARTSGYGNAFCERVIVADTCLNLARAGRSSASFRGEGRWDEVQGLLRGAAAYRATYVLIQFGHNDQPGKPGHSTDLASEFPANMMRYARDVRALGGVPVLVTPLTRRNFVDGVLDNNLRPWADAALKVGRQEHVAVLDLNADSYTAVQAMGQDEADTLAVEPRPAGWVGPAVLPGSPGYGLATPENVRQPSALRTAFDRTHLGRKGSAFFSRMVETELNKALPELRAEFSPEIAQ
ncbi:hydrolase [Massilia sp. TW-1]|uniref:Hydrolase n=1 Tax=Telluria antibiotica TaxID=2717319 RepID=A0ABX0PLM2_9BURK|nr:GDSL-type esterase/lipase family protein [Telluria antibiotica]NIA57716.1 hydrolase [Telluria antibiotica]